MSLHNTYHGWNFTLVPGTRSSTFCKFKKKYGSDKKQLFTRFLSCTKGYEILHEVNIHDNGRWIFDTREYSEIICWRGIVPLEQGHCQRIVPDTLSSSNYSQSNRSAEKVGKDNEEHESWTTSRTTEFDRIGEAHDVRFKQKKTLSIIYVMKRLWALRTVKTYQGVLFPKEVARMLESNHQLNAQEKCRPLANHVDESDMKEDIFYIKKMFFFSCTKSHSHDFHFIITLITGQLPSLYTSFISVPIQVRKIQKTSKKWKSKKKMNCNVRKITE